MKKGKLNGLDLFSGYGGISLALGEYVTPIMYCEIEKYAQGILLSNIDKGVLPFGLIWNDVTTLNGKPLKGLVDIVFGGFPCQDISTAGKGAGLAGERSGLFYQIIRICQEASPLFIFLENVPAIRTRGANDVAQALADIGYDSRWCHVSAAEVGANHKRERWFLLAHSPHSLRKGLDGSRIEIDFRKEQSRIKSSSRNLADSSSERLERGEQLRIDFKENGNGQPCSSGAAAKRGHDGRGKEELADSMCGGLERQGASWSAIYKAQIGDWEANIPESIGFKHTWDIEPSVGRVVDGPSVRSHQTAWMGEEMVLAKTGEPINEEDKKRYYRPERIKALGNGVVPLQVKSAFEILMGIAQ